MNKILPFLLILAFFATSCNNDLDLTAETKNIPVVYGILSSQDSAHYIRVEKAFIDDKIDAITLASDPANLYYEDITVELRRLSDGTVYPLTRVAGEDEGYPRAEGVFASTPNYLYKINDSVIDLVGAENLQLEIKLDENSDLITAEATILRGMTLKRPTPPSNTTNGTKHILQIGQDTKLEIEAGGEAKIYDAFVNLHYWEHSPSGVRTAETFVWKMAENFRSEGDTRFIIERPGTAFFTSIAATLDANPAITRQYRKLSIDITAGGVALEEYINLTQANTGITSAQEIPNYTNLSEGVGVFSSKVFFHADSIGLSDNSREDLFNSDLTASFNFE